MDITQMDQWYGAVGAIICGAGARNLGVVIGVAGAAGVSVVVAACFVMLLDAFSSS